MRTYNKYMDGSRVLLGAHRGDRKNFPENTMEAFRGAVAVGCDAIETDVRMTKDGHLVLIHDRDVKRTTNGEGFVDEMTLEEIRALDAGFWKGEEFVGAKIPTVEEFLEYVSKTDLIINWELKEYPKDLGLTRAFACVDKLVELIDRYGMAERSMMNSFSDLLLDYVSDKWKGKFVIHGYIHYKSPKDSSVRPLESFLDWAAIWHKDEAHSVGYESDYVYAKERDILTCILVPDAEEHYARSLSYGCRMFTSDDPTTAAQVLRSLGER